MSNDGDAKETTNLPVPVAVKNRVLVQAKGDMRTYKAELLALVIEALDRREKINV